MGKFIYTVYAVIVVLATTGASAPGRALAARAPAAAPGAAQHRLVQRVAQVTVHATPGRHVLADFTAGRRRPVRRGRAGALLAAADAAGARAERAFPSFREGAGVTGVVMLSESHISIHTWPEHGYAALDVFMCGAARPERALDSLRAALAPASVRVTVVDRG